MAKNSSIKPDKKASPAEPAAARDVVLVHGLTEDKKGLQVLRAREERLELGEVRPIEEGKPLHGDIVRLKPRPQAPFLCDVETELRVPRSASPQGEGAPSESRRARSGPAQVASDAYRANWDAIWQRSSSKNSDTDLN